MSDDRLVEALEYFALSLKPASKQFHLRTVIGAAKERLALTEFLNRVDGLASLVAFRFPAGLPGDVVEALKDLSREARLMLKAGHQELEAK